MEYLEGETLAAHLHKSGPLPIEKAAALICQVAEAMAAAHAVGIVHRDLKPENLFLVGGTDGRLMVKVLDFGIAKMRVPAGLAALTQVGFIMGTPLYSSPEQFLGEDVGPAADTYALGACAFEMLTGRPPFVGESTQVLGAKTTRDAPSVREFRAELPEPVAKTVACMLARSVSERFASMAEVRAEVSAWPTTPVSLHEPIVSRRVLLWAVAIGGVLASCVMLVWWLSARLVETVPQPAATSAQVAVPIAPAAAPAPAAATPVRAAPARALAPAVVTPTRVAVPAAAPATVVATPATEPHVRPHAARAAAVTSAEGVQVAPAKPKAHPPKKSVSVSGKAKDVIIADPFQ